MAGTEKHLLHMIFLWRIYNQINGKMLGATNMQDKAKTNYQ